jgi:xanthine dehydrogenase accessory factor
VRGTFYHALMESLDLRVLNDALSWRQAAHAVTLVTVVDTWGSAPRPAGALLAVRGDGVVARCRAAVWKTI